MSASLAPVRPQSYAGGVPDNDVDAAQEEPGRGAQILGFLIMAALLVGIALLVKALYPSEVSTSEDPTFIDTIFENKTVIWAARLLLVSAAFVLAVGGVFIVASTFVWMKNQQWLKRAGPFEVSDEALNELQGQIEFWRAAALASQEEINELSERLQASDALLEASLEETDEEE